MEIDLTKMEKDLNVESYKKHIDTIFAIATDDKPIELVLTEATTGKAIKKGPGVPDSIRDDPFALLFRGPADTPLPQRLYSIRHEELGDLVLFLVPVGIDEEGRYYEAIFN